MFHTRLICQVSDVKLARLSDCEEWESFGIKREDELESPGSEELAEDASTSADLDAEGPDHPATLAARFRNRWAGVSVSAASSANLNDGRSR